MGVAAVLHPQDCLQTNPIPIPRAKPTRNPNHRPQPNHNRRKRSPNSSPPSRPAAAKGNNKNVNVPSNNSSNNNNLVQGQVRILKRGETLPETAPLSSPPEMTEIKPSDLGLNGPNPAQNKAIGFYAGSAFITSPPPSSLPLPGFFAKKVVEDAEADPTRALQRLLGLRL